MATEEVPVTKDSLEEKLGDLKVEEPEKFEDTTETPPEEAPEESKEAVLEELTESPPKLHHVETEDTTDPVAEPTSEGDVVKAEVPEAFEEELKKDHDIVPPTDEKSTSPVESVKSETGAAADGSTAPPTDDKPTSPVESVKSETGAAEDGSTAPAAKEIPVEDAETKPPSKTTSFGEKISTTLHKIVGKE